MARHRAAAVAAVALVVLAVAPAVPTGRTLVVADTETGETYLRTPVENGTTVTLAYTHSVEKTPVRDVYTVDGNRLVATRMAFESYGWGLPSRANVSREGGQFVYDPPGEYRRLTVAPGDVAGHRLRVGNRSYDLVELTDERSVDVYVDRRSAVAAAVDSL
ncbi:DUF1850 domain-containing protein [Haloarcula onubensis]|uniref:DUF1850 domain-containing protein n=1 Tax=Haloarcula onubensis TaxID=2950539 RepID=A0ABU2FP23_9EURY|nr:DUF1850 domain-containing protein [Halomicroarcula sp. S3CR25-11]MDS0282510.1 DUF1850 domain-containing protein [Halomicroarcula sp. S3CR25-11]